LSLFSEWLFYDFSLYGDTLFIVTGHYLIRVFSFFPLCSLCPLWLNKFYSVSSVALLCGVFDFCPFVAESYSAVEDEFSGGAVGVNAEIAKALELIPV
jgi:hypothetical protein